MIKIQTFTSNKARCSVDLSKKYSISHFFPFFKFSFSEDSTPQTLEPFYYLGTVNGVPAIFVDILSTIFPLVDLSLTQLYIGFRDNSNTYIDPYLIPDKWTVDVQFSLSDVLVGDIQEIPPMYFDFLMNPMGNAGIIQSNYPSQFDEDCVAIMDRIKLCLTTLIFFELQYGSGKKWFEKTYPEFVKELESITRLAGVPF